MEKIDFKLINSIDDVELQNYFIMPYYSFDNLVYINISKSSIDWYNNSLKKISGYKNINLNLNKMYKNSKFFGYDISLICFLTKTKNKKTLMIFDLLLKDEIFKKNQSKKYSIRLDNIKNRFIDPKSKIIFPIFAQKMESNEIDQITMKMIESNSWEGLIFYKDKPYNYDLDSSSLLFYKAWETKTGKIISCEFGLNGDEKPLITSITVYNDELKNSFKICGNLAEIQKNYNYNTNELINKEILFKYCFIKSENNIMVLTNFLKFK